MDLTSSPSMDKDLMDLTNHHRPPQHEEDDRDVNNNGIGIKKEEIVPSYDFLPIRGGLSQSLNLDSSVNNDAAVGARVWNSSENKPNSSLPPVRNFGSLDNFDCPKFNLGNRSDATIVSDIDQTMKKYADNLLHVLEGVSARLTQLDARTRNLESSVDDLKVSVGSNHASTDGKMRQVENILREVQSGILVLKDKQEMLEAQMQHGKLQGSKVDQPSESRSTVHTEAVHQSASASLQSHIQHPSPPVTFPQSVPPLPSTIAPPALQQNLSPATQQNLPAAPQQNLPPAVQLPNQFLQSQNPTVSQRDPYHPIPGQTQDVPSQQYPVPPTQQSQAPPPAPPHQPYQPTPPPSYSQPPQPQYSQPPQLPLSQSSLGHLPEETAYMPSQNYPPNLRQPASQTPSVSPPSQTYYGAPPSHLYESPPSRPNSGFPTGYGTHSGPNEPHPYGGPPSQYVSGSTIKPQQHSSAMMHSGGSGYLQLPSARVLPQSIPSASGASGGPGSPGTGNRVPIDDVVAKVASMGFPRDHVRATVQKMTENGQSVDLNKVLDKLMSDGEVQPPRGWFGR